MIKYLIFPICISVSGCATQVDLMRIDNQQKLAEMREMRKANLENKYFETLQKQFYLKFKTSQTALSKKMPVIKDDQKEQNISYSVPPTPALDTLSSDECNRLCKNVNADCEMKCPETCDDLYGDCSDEQPEEVVQSVQTVKSEPYKKQNAEQIVYNFGDGNTISGSTSDVTSFGSNQYKGPLDSLGASIAKEYTKDQETHIQTTGEQAMSFAGKLIKPLSDTIKVLGIANIIGSTVEAGLQEAGNETNTNAGMNQIGNALSVDGASGANYDESVVNESNESIP